MPPTTPPDAIMLPRPWPKETAQPQGLFRKLFGPVMGLPPRQKLYTFSQGNMYFLVKSTNESLLFPTAHELSGRDRFDWFVVAEDATLTMLADPEQVETWSDRPEAVKFGWLRDEDDITPPSVDAKVHFMRQVQDRDLAWKQLLGDYRALKAKPEAERSESEQADLDEIEAAIRELSDKGPPRLPT